MTRSYIITVLLIAVFPFVGLSQDESQTNQAKMDSLDHLIDEVNDGEEKIFLLNEYARYCFYNKRLADGLMALREARNLAEELASNEGMRLNNLTLSVFHWTGGMSAYYQKKAEWISSRTDEESPEAETYLSNSEPDEAQLNAQIKELSGLLSQFGSDQDMEFSANILTFLSYRYFRLSDIESSEEYLSSAVELFAEIDELTPVILLSGYRMNMLRTLDRESAAKEVELYLVDLVANNKNTNRLYYITSAMGDAYANSGRSALAIEYYLKSLEEAEKVEDFDLLANVQLDIGTAYENLGLNNKAVEHYLKGIEAIKKIEDSTFLSYAYGVSVFPLIALGEYEKAKEYMDRVILDTARLSFDKPAKTYYLARYYDASGQLLMGQDKYKEAIPFLNKAFDLFESLDGFEWAAPYIKLYLTECYLKTGDLTKAINNGLECFEMTDDPRVRIRVSLLLSETYEEMSNLPLAYEYLKTHVDIKAESEKLDELNRIADAEIRSIIEKSQSQINELEQERAESEQASKIQRFWIISIAGALISTILISLILYRNNVAKQKVNRQLEQQKEDLQKAMNKLSATQSQLIHAEKMASLGELTAGIAHEIQNPLNFVNNFSDVSKELVSELIEESQKDKEERDEKLEMEILNDVDQNLGKILHHGKRASDIVKSMLQHSRGSEGEKEPTNINTICDEFLRLAYHGLRAKDKSFNANFKLDLDEKLPEVEVIPQDMGRVLLNLINNAFQACAEPAIENPEVIVATKYLEDQIEISISDNGQGIPEELMEKIFQPFFTTKSTGQGTGLGLSLSYDIVKAHGGSLEVESVVGQGTTFRILLPIKK